MAQRSIFAFLSLALIAAVLGLTPFLAQAAAAECPYISGVFKGNGDAGSEEIRSRVSKEGTTYYSIGNTEFAATGEDVGIKGAVVLRLLCKEGALYVVYNDVREAYITKYRPADEYLMKTKFLRSPERKDLPEVSMLNVERYEQSPVHEPKNCPVYNGEFEYAGGDLQGQRRKIKTTLNNAGAVYHFGDEMVIADGRERQLPKDQMIKAVCNEGRLYTRLFDVNDNLMRPRLLKTKQFDGFDKKEKAFGIYEFNRDDVISSFAYNVEKRD